MFVHLDMDYFFAQVEERDNPLMKGRIVCVCVFSGRTEESGVISTVNYQGRKFGIKSGMPIVFAKKKASGMSAFFIPLNREKYEAESFEIYQIIKNEFEKTAQMSIDEWNCLGDVDVFEKAKKIKEEIFKERKLTCSVGIAPSSIGAKIAAGKNKPNGLTKWDERIEREEIMKMDIIEIPGFGPKTSEVLLEMGAKKVEDLKKIDKIKIIEKFGKKTGGIINQIRDADFPKEFVENKDQEGYSRIGTLKEITRESKEIISKIEELESELKNQIAKEKKQYKTLSVILISENLKIHTKSKTFRKAKNFREENTREIEELVGEFLATNDGKIRRVGIRYSNMENLEGQTTLF
jgi:DNA polymerase IV (DinB-like DNA polymerase)